MRVVVWVADRGDLGAGEGGQLWLGWLSIFWGAALGPVVPGAACGLVYTRSVITWTIVLGTLMSLASWLVLHIREMSCA